MVIIPPIILSRVIIAILSIAPTILLIRNYMATKLDEYLIFALFFLFGGLHHGFSVVVYHYHALWIFQLYYLISHISFVFLLFHSLQVMRKSWRNPAMAIGLIWFGIILILMAFWKLEMQQPTAEVLFVNMKATYSPFFPEGATTRMFGTIVYASSHRIFSILFNIYVTTVGLIAYATVENIDEKPEVEVTRKIWFISFSLLTFYLILHLPGLNLILFGQLIEPGVFIVAGLGGVLYLVLAKPESFFLTREQIMRAYQLYRSYKEDSDSSFPSDRLWNYFTSVVEETNYQSDQE